MKRNWLILLFFIGVIHMLFAQDIEMITEWEKAKQIATLENKNILIILTGSSWCAPCKKMDHKVLPSKEFQKYVSKNLVIFLIDLPGGGIFVNNNVYIKYHEFKETYNAQGLPSLIITDKDGQLIKLLTGKVYNLKNVMQQLESL